MELLQILQDGGFVDTLRFPIRTVYRGVDLGASTSAFMEPLIAAGARNRIVRVDGATSATLLTMKAPQHFGGLVSRLYRDPYDLVRAAAENPYGVLAAVAWGSGTVEMPRYQANVFRKALGWLQAALEQNDYKGTFELVLDEYGFPCVVPSVDDQGRFTMGVFPFGGVELFQIGHLWGLGGFSAASQIEDPTLGVAAAMFVGSLIYRNTPPGESPYAHLVNLQVEYATADDAVTTG